MVTGEGAELLGYSDNVLVVTEVKGEGRRVLSLLTSLSGWDVQYFLTRPLDVPLQWPIELSLSLWSL